MQLYWISIGDGRKDSRSGDTNIVLGKSSTKSSRSVKVAVKEVQPLLVNKNGQKH